MKNSFPSLIVPLRLSLELVLLGQHGEARGHGRRLVLAVAVEGVHDPLHAGHEAALLLHLRRRMNGRQRQDKPHHRVAAAKHDGGTRNTKKATCKSKPK